LAQVLSTSLQGGFRFLYPPLPPDLSAYLTVYFPLWGGLEAYHVPCKQQQWVRFSLYTGNLIGYAVLGWTVPTLLLAILAQAYQCFWPVWNHDASN